MTDEREKMTLETFQEGALLEQFNRELAAAVADIADINTTEKPREILLKMKIKPSEDRTFFEASGQVSTKLGGPPPIKTTGDIIQGAGGCRAFNRRPKQLDLPFNVTRLNDEGGHAK
jgi:hypothetical protein